MSDLAQGADNLVRRCAGIEPGMSVVVIHEDPALGWYDLEAPMAVADAARALGADVSLLPVGAPTNEPNPHTVDAVNAHDCTIFFSRIGDQDRFEAAPAGKTVVMSYARTAGSLASAYGRADHRAFLAMKAAVNTVMFGAEEVRMICPLGTEVSGSVPRDDLDTKGDVWVRRFPMGVHQPLDASRFSGRVALAHYLTPTGSKVYEPASARLDSPVFVTLEDGRWRDPQGEPGPVAAMEAHYRRVAETFGLDPWGVDSWHAGFHPGVFYEGLADRDPDNWSNTVFTSPRFLHFHTCGKGPPGEICWMVYQPTVTVEGIALWQRGRFRPEVCPETRDCLDAWPELVSLYADPADRVGL